MKFVFLIAYTGYNFIDFINVRDKAFIYTTWAVI